MLLRYDTINLRKKFKLLEETREEQKEFGLCKTLSETYSLSNWEWDELFWLPVIEIFMNIDWVFEYRLVWTTIVFGNSRYSFYQIHFIKYKLSNINYRIHIHKFTIAFLWMICLVWCNSMVEYHDAIVLFFYYII